MSGNNIGGLLGFLFSLALLLVTTKGDVLKFIPYEQVLFDEIKANSSFSFASYYGDHMVLQQAPKRSIVWGYADLDQVGLEVKVTLETSAVKNYGVYSASVRIGPFPDKAVWSVQLEAVPHGGPYTITATIQGQTVTLTDVMFGDVWICSGQSNMQFTVSMMLNASEELARVSEYKHIRLFTAAEVLSKTPLYDLQTVQQPWALPSQDSVGHSDWSYFSAVCWLYGRMIYEQLNYPIGLIATDWGGTPIQSWSSPDALSQCQQDCPRDMTIQDYQGDGISPSFIAESPDTKSVLWNAMINPFLNLTIYGAIWYQGEANSGASNYDCMFGAMISDWRQKFHTSSHGQTDPTFPFGFVQLAPFQNDSALIDGYPTIRWQQTGDVGYVPNNNQREKVFMALALDLPDYTSKYGSVHPRDKLTVGERLALSGMAVAYGRKNIKFQGPLPSAYFMDLGFFTLRIEYDAAKTLLDIRNNEGFEVCCSVDHTTVCQPNSPTNWTAAPLIKSDNTSVTLSWKQCANQYIVGLRYLWRQSPCPYKECAIYSVKNNLPAPPYVSIGWFGQSQNGQMRKIPNHIPLKPATLAKCEDQAIP